MKPYHVIRNTFLTGLCIGLLTGCSWFGDWPPGKTEKTAQSAPRPPESKTVESKANGSAGNSSVAAAQPKGIVSDSDAATRIAQLEATVAQLRNDISMMMPALTRLAQIQDAAQNIAQIEPAAGAAMQPPMAITQPTPEAGTVAWYEAQERAQRQAQSASVPVPANVSVPQQEPAVSPATYQPAAYEPESAQENVQGDAQGGGFVTNVRFGEHPDKTRLVLDTSNMVSFSHTIDNSGQVLTISLPQTGWNGPAQMDVGNSPLVASYSAAPDDQGGEILTVQLKHPARVLWAQALMPGGPQGHRIVFDLAPL